MPNLEDKNAIAFDFAQLCSEASVAIMEIYATDFKTRGKDDNSPVTDADDLAEKVILAGLSQMYPDVAVLAEESFASGFRPDIGSAFILVDPVDGTKEFINKNGEFTVNIALIEDGKPTAGCVYAPAIERIFVGGSEAWAGSLEPGQAVDKTKLDTIKTRQRPATGLKAVMSRSHVDEKTLSFAEAKGVTDRVSAGSSLKFCLVADGTADVYPRFGPTREWDTGAGHAVLNAAGGCVIEPSGAPFMYGKQSVEYLNGAFIAWGIPPKD